MTIERLKVLMPPPAAPVFSGSVKDWAAFNDKVGLSFPEDYFALSNIYGSGRFLAGEFKIANPFDPDDEGFATRELLTMRERKASAPDAVPYPIYPDPGGLYPFGIDGNGNTFLWLTDGVSDGWPIACFNSEDYSEVVNHRITEFLALLACNTLGIRRRKFWGSDFPEDQLEFIPRRVPTRGNRKSTK